MKFSPGFTGYFLLTILFSGFSATLAQETPNRADYRIHIAETTSPMTIDGIFDEPAWQTAEKVTNFHRVLPIDTGYARSQSEVMMTYDQQNLYLAIIFYDDLPGKRPVESLRRDFSFGKNDNFLLFMDTYNDQTNGFSFGASAAGAQWDGIQANGGSVNLSWDCKWKSEVKNYDDRWVIEMGIPFRSIRYQAGVKEWGINFSRLDLKSNEKSSWAPVPRQFPTASLAYTGTLVWDKAPPENKSFVSLIPYVSSRVSKSYDPEEPADPGVAAGIDAKIGLTPTLNLDLTVNPDFSQVEVDRQVTNLNRFELFFPERRRFFLENNTVFADYGSEAIRPFFSRRIGLNNPVRAGVRLSGNLNEDWRIGFLNMQTGTRDFRNAQTGEEELLPAANFTVASVQRQVFARSSIGAFFVNKQLTVSEEDTAYSGFDRYNRVAGIDYNIASADNRWTGKVFFHKAFLPGDPQKSFATAARLEYNTQQVYLGWNQSYVGQNYRAETGFVPRNSFHQINPAGGYKFFPESRHIANHGPYVQLDAFFDESFDLTDREVEAGYQTTFMNRSTLSLEYENGFLRLLFPFDPTNTGRDSLETGDEFRWHEWELAYASTQRNLFTYELSARYGGYFGGERVSLNGEINYRVQPYGSLAMVASYNQIRLPEPFSDANLILIGPKLDITFTDNIFLTTFVQYNNQIDNVNVNIRFQWRYAPVSDLFIVYTDNSYPENFKVKNRALVAKLSYWFN